MEPSQDRFVAARDVDQLVATLEELADVRVCELVKGPPALSNVVLEPADVNSNVSLADERARGPSWAPA